MQPARLWKKTKNNRVQCNLCHHRCNIPLNVLSRCGTRQNIEGELQVTGYGFVSGVNVDPIEKKPLFHFYPGTTVYSIGGWGCNFLCKNCQNHSISHQFLPEDHQLFLSPEKAVSEAIAYGASGIAWTYNEPTIHFEYTYDMAQLAKENNLYTVYVTNGFTTPEALETIAPYLDAYRVDLKGFDKKSYLSAYGIAHWESVLESSILAKQLGMHVEIVTNIIPTYNDAQDTLIKLAEWIYSTLGAETPWHITRFFPHYKMMDIPPTPIATLHKAKAIGLQQGLKHIYLGNVSEENNTYCPACQTLLIERHHFMDSATLHLTSHTCPKCCASLNIKIRNGNSPQVSSRNIIKIR